MTALRRYRLTTTLESQATVGDGLLRGNVRSTRQWIPGETTLGALAAAVMREHGPTIPKDSRFVDLFRHGRFGPAYIDRTTLMPLSVVACKYKTRQECAGSTWDLAWTTPSADPYDRCPVCHGKTEFGKGQVIGPREFLEPSVQTHVRLTTRETATDGDLFQRSTMRAATTFSSHAYLPDAATDLLPMDPAGPPAVRIRLGGARSSQGAARVHLVPDAVEPDVPLTTTGRLVVRLLSPGVLVDRWGRPAQEPAAWAWELDAAFPGLGARVDRQWIRWEEHGGWQSRGFPKPRERVVAAGSVFTIVFDTRPTAEQLADFRRGGVGLRTGHGFGWIELDRWQDVARQSEPISAAAEESSSLRALAGSDRVLARRVLNVLRSLEGLEGTPDIEATLWRREWFRALPPSQQRNLAGLLSGVTDLPAARSDLDDALRTAPEA